MRQSLGQKFVVEGRVKTKYAGHGIFQMSLCIICS